MAEGRYRSFAKINLHLAVLGRHDDGYHELETVFQTVALHDVVGLRLTELPGVRLEVPAGGAPNDATNLAWRAAAMTLDRWAPDVGVDIELVKSIPAGGGLGGGSSNAATVLSALADLLPTEVGESWKVDAARRLGADVPYFLTGGTALGTGRGDRVEPLPELASEEVWLAVPPVSVSTAAAFRDLALPERRSRPAAIDALRAGEAPPSLAALGGWNDLEAVVFERFPAVRNVYNALRRAGATLVRLSGSGATVFARFDPRQIGDLEGELPSGTRVHRTRTLSRDQLSELRIVDSEHESGP